jgi:5-formyltetrahydrofolate cyclo-ligase
MPQAAPVRAALRRTMRTARRAFVGALAPPVRSGLEAALAREVVPRLPGTAAILGSHASVGDEIDPAAIEHASVARGWVLAFPRVRGPLPLSFHIARFEQLQPGFAGIPEPAAELPEVRPDVLLVPLLAVDLCGNRLGQGGGHFDRTLKALRSEGPVIAIGLAWDLQVVDSLPVAGWDEPLDAIATPTRFHWTRDPPRWAA